jgi:opacity protein-like surface antigen
MRKIALGVLVALIAASPAVAAKKSKKEAVPAKIDSNEASWRLVRDSLPIYLPAWAMPLYMASQTPDKKKK